MSACAALLALFPVAGAHAESAHVDVPASCGSRAAFLREVETLREQPLVAEPTFALRIVPEGAGFRMTLSSPAGERELEDARCASLFAAAALMVVVELERGAAPTPSAPVEAVPSLPDATPQPPETPERFAPITQPEAPRREAPDVVRPRPPSHAFADLAAGLARGPTPRFAARVELGAGMRFGRVGARLAAHYGTPRRVEGVRIQDLGGSVLASVRAPGWLELGLGAEAHALPGRGRHGGRDVSLAFGPRAELWFVPLTRRGELAIGGAFTYLPRRPEFVTPAEERLYRAPPFALSLSARGRVGFF